MPEKIIGNGAEAKIILENNFIIKDRVSKSYRIKEIDEKIRKHRTKTEKKLLEKASKIINAPNPFPLENNFQIKMPFIKGKKLSETLNKFSLKKQKEICRIVGGEIAKLHDANIIHGDLTTSNMILVDNNSPRLTNIPGGGREFARVPEKNLVATSAGSSWGRINERNHKGMCDGEQVNFQIFFIDFGLGFISDKAEDKAVDLHLLKQALEAKHYDNWEVLFKEIEEGYKINKESKKILERFKAVEKRGRYKEH